MPGKGFHLNTPDLRSAGSSLNSFSERLKGHNSRLESVGGKVSANGRRDKSGVGSKISGFADKATDVFRKFLGESSRVTGQSGKNLHKGADDLDKTEDSHVSTIKKLHTDAKIPDKLATIKEEPRVRFDEDAKKHDGGGKYQPPAKNDATNPEKTGAGTQHLTSGESSNTHPLKTKLDENDDPHLTKVSEQQGKDLNRPGAFSKKNRPGMASSLQTGDANLAHSSMKKGTPKRHKLVDQVLDELATRDEKGELHPTGIGPVGKGHGRCAEVGSISDYLHKVDPDGRWTVEDARNHFEHVGGATDAHRPGADEHSAIETPPCDSCSYLTNRLGIHSMDSQTGEGDNKDLLKDYDWDKRSETPGRIGKGA